MYPVGFYDLREATPAIPAVSTAFRPLAREELAQNPFRVFTSLLVVDDQRFFDERSRPTCGRSSVPVRCFRTSFWAWPT